MLVDYKETLLARDIIIVMSKLTEEGHVEVNYVRKNPTFTAVKTVRNFGKAEITVYKTFEEMSEDIMKLFGYTLPNAELLR